MSGSLRKRTSHPHRNRAELARRRRYGAFASVAFGALALSFTASGCAAEAPATNGSAGAGVGATGGVAGAGVSGAAGSIAPSGGVAGTGTAGAGGASGAGMGGMATTGGMAGTGVVAGGATSAGGTAGDLGAGGSVTSGGAPPTGGMAGIGAGGVAGTGTAGTGTAGTGTAGTGTAGTGTAGTGSGTSREVWVAPDGNDANPGTEALPVKTICDTAAKVGACYKLCPSSYSCPATGATIWVKGGTHAVNVKIDIGATRPGVAGGTMKLYAVPGTRPVLDASGLPTDDLSKTGVALHIKASHWHVKGLEIKSAPHNCIKVEGGHNVIENVAVHDCGNTGITIGHYAGEDMSDTPGGSNTILNCDSYDNVGINGEGEDADGFGAKESGGANNVFRGCRAWNNADDGYDFYGWVNPITVENSWAFESGLQGADGGDGNGFKLGLGPGNHVLRDAIAAYNTKRGYTSNGADNQSTCTNCRGCENDEGLNDTGDRAVLGSVSNMSPCVDLAKAKGARGADGSLPAL